MVKINKLYILYRIDYVFNKNEDILLVQRIKLIVNTMIRRKKSFWDVLWRPLQNNRKLKYLSQEETFKILSNFPRTGCPSKFTARSEPAMLTEIQELQCYGKIVIFIICHVSDHEMKCIMFQIMEFILYCIYLILNLVKFFIMSICSLRSCIGYILYHDCSFNGNSGKLGAMVVSKSTKEYKSSHHRESFYS